MARKSSTPLFIVAPTTGPDAAVNTKIYTTIVGKLPDKAGVLSVEIKRPDDDQRHGLYLFRNGNRLLGICYMKTTFPDLKPFLTTNTPGNPNPIEANNNTPLNGVRPNLTPQQIAAMKQQMNQAMNMAGQPVGFNQANMAAMFGMNNNGMFMGGANPLMNQAAMQNMLNIEAMRRAQQQVNPAAFASMAQQQQLAHQLQQQQQQQGAGIHPQQFQQLQLQQQAQRHQLNRPPNPPPQ